MKIINSDNHNRREFNGLAVRTQALAVGRV